MAMVVLTRLHLGRQPKNSLVANLNLPGSNVTVAGNLRNVAALTYLARVKREGNILLDRFRRGEQRCAQNFSQ